MGMGYIAAQLIYGRMTVSKLRMIYLALAIWGATHPMYYFAQWSFEQGFSVGGMLDAMHVNAASSGLVWDLIIAAIALTVWIILTMLAACCAGYHLSRHCPMLLHSLDIPLIPKRNVFQNINKFWESS